MESGVGSGVFSRQLLFEKSYRLPDFSSVYQAELLAIQKAAEMTAIKCISDKDISFYIDNQAAIISLGSPNIRSRLVHDCRKVLQELFSQNRVRL